MLNVQEKAPEFTLPDQSGKSVSLSDFAGRKVVLYFYPKDNTTACTSQAVAMNAQHDRFEALGATLLGVSRDTVKSHEKFAAALGLTFPILADPALNAINAYGVFREKKMYGKSVMGIARTTFIIDEHGAIEKIFEKVKAAQNADEVIAYLSGKHE